MSLIFTEKPYNGKSIVPWHKLALEGLPEIGYNTIKVGINSKRIHAGKSGEKRSRCARIGFRVDKKTRGYIMMKRYKIPGSWTNIRNPVQIVGQERPREGSSLCQNSEPAKHGSDLEPILEFADEVELLPAEAGASKMSMH